MKKKLPLILAACAAALLIAGYLLVTADEDPARTGVLHRSGADETVTEMQIKNTYGDFTFTLHDGEWLVSDGTGQYHTNSDKMNLLTASLLNFSVLRVLPEGSAEYGLDAPRAAVSYKTSKGYQQVLVLGDSAANAAESYVSADGVSGVIITDAASVAQLTGSLKAYRTNQVFVVDLYSLQTIDYAGETGSLTLTKDSAGNWSITAPVSAPARRLEMNEFISSLLVWSIADYPDGKFDAELGLDAPTETLTLTDSAGTTQTLSLGSVDSTLRYARIGGREDTVALYATDVDLSALSMESLIYETPLNIPVTETNRFTLTMGGDSWEFTYDSQAQTAFLGNRPIEYDDFVGIYYRVVLLLADGWDAETVPGDTVATVELGRTDGSSVTLTLRQRDEDTLFMDYASGAQFYMDASRLQKLTERITALG